MNIPILRFWLYATAFAVNFPLYAQSTYTLQPVYANDSLSFRGLSAPTDSVVWVSGTKGTVGKSLDGGHTWQWMTVPGYAQRDFRDIEAFDANTAVIMAIAEPAHILRTTDGGKHWQLVFADSTTGMFLDAMHFKNDRDGIVVGDPINGKLFVKGTADGGKSWQVNYESPRVQTGEACFASSGTNVVMVDNGGYAVVTGGTVSRFFRGQTDSKLPLIQGKESTGANSIASWQGKTYVVVGGDFKNDQAVTGNAAISLDGGKSWQTPGVPPHGYRSCVAYLDERTLISCGTSGVDVSVDGGKRWQRINESSFHVCQKAKNGKAVFLAGAKGRIARLVVSSQ